jgi:hypothetical protein
MLPNKFDVGIAYVLKIGIIRIKLKILLIRSSIFSIFLSQLFYKFFCHLPFFFEFALFFIVFPNKNCQVKKIQNQKHVGWGQGV